MAGRTHESLGSVPPLNLYAEASSHRGVYFRAVCLTGEPASSFSRYHFNLRQLSVSLGIGELLRANVSNAVAQPAMPGIGVHPRVPEH